QGFSDPKFAEFFFYMVTFVYNWFGTTQLNDLHRMPLDGTGNHFWSICVEEQFYLVAPFILIFCNRLMLLIGLAAATILAPGYFASISLGVALSLLNPTKWLIAFLGSSGAVGAFFGSYLIAAPLLSVACVGLLAKKGPQTAVGRIVGGASYPFYL